MDNRRETIAPHIHVYTGGGHTFGADALMLSGFATLRAGETVFDLGAGCGIIGAALFARQCPPGKLHAVEISPEGADLARQTAGSPGIGGRMAVHNLDLRHVADHFPAGCADMVICNPPYYERGSGRLPPGDARRTARSDTACTLDDVCGAAAFLLRPMGRFCLCYRAGGILPLMDALRRAGIEPKRIAMAAHSAHKAPFILLCEGVRGGRPGLTWEPTRYTAETTPQPD